MTGPFGVAVGREVRRDEGVHRAGVPALVLGPPAVADVVGRLPVLGGRVALQMERLQVPGGSTPTPGS